MSRPESHNNSGDHRRIVRTLVLVAVGMFGFGFALWPIYNIFCEITGFGGRGVSIESPSAERQVVVSDRTVRVRFDATTHSDLPWQFEPGENVKEVQLGAVERTQYLALNTSDSSVSGNAIFNVTPPEASLYFVKTECFCFTEQALDANEAKEMPVVFYVQPDLPENISEITLSYTFFRDDKAKPALAVADTTP